MPTKTATETQATLAKKLVRLAYANPDQRAQILPLLIKLGMVQSKVAVSVETEDFVQWVLSTQAVMNPSDVESFITRQLQVRLSPPVQQDTGPRFVRGDSVIIRATKHVLARKYDKSNYTLYNGKVGTVSDTEGMDVLVVFQSGSPPVRFYGGQERQGVGIYKYTKPYTINGSEKIEMIYFAGGQATQDAKLVVDAYMERGKKTERRSAHYYTGHIVFASEGKKGFYFRGFPQQRMEVDPTSEGGIQPRSFNPKLGSIYYIGIVGRRPNGWKEQLAELSKAFEAAGGTRDTSPVETPAEELGPDTRSDEELFTGRDMLASRLAKKLIRVAHANPDQRDHILPMVRKLIGNRPTT